MLADCVRDANAAMDALMVYNDRALDWTKSETRFGIASKASIYGYALDRCDGMAGDALHKAPEFRRLVDGAKAGLALIPKAIATRDSDLLHRVLIELRSFDNLLGVPLRLAPGASTYSVFVIYFRAIRTRAFSPRE